MKLVQFPKQLHEKWYRYCLGICPTSPTLRNEFSDREFGVIFRYNRDKFGYFEITDERKYVLFLLKFS